MEELAGEAQVVTGTKISLFAMGPLVCYWMKHRGAAGSAGFGRFIGLYPPERKADYVVLWLAGGYALLLHGSCYYGLARGGNGYGRVLAGNEILIPDAMFLYGSAAVLKSTVADEILFRGLIGKQLAGLLGFWVGNWIQVFLFGMTPSDSIFCWSTHDVSAVSLSLLLTSSIGAGLLLGALKEKRGNGSLVPSMLLYTLWGVNAVMWFPGHKTFMAP
ncbi:MAG: protease self-immunity protein family [Paenibacillus sp.]|nr:protease self-immunity protein family [Paenibacillus sp.]